MKGRAFQAEGTDSARPGSRHVQNFKGETHVAGMNGGQGGGKVRDDCGLVRTLAILIMT